MELTRFATLARGVLDRFAMRHQRPWLPASLRLVTLCQGAAHHHAVAAFDITPVVGRPLRVKDIDVWLWFSLPSAGERPYPWRVRHRIKACPLERPGSFPDYVGRIDVLGRSVLPVDADPVEELHAYLMSGRSETARRLAAAPVIGLWPDRLCGRLLWSAAATDTVNTAERPSSS